MSLVRLPRLAVYCMLALSLIAVFALANGAVSLVGQPLVSVGHSEVRIENSYTPQEGFFDVAAFCREKNTKVTRAPTTDNAPEEFVLINSLTLIRWKAGADNHIAAMYIGDASPTSVEITKSAETCVMEKVGK